MGLCVKKRLIDIEYGAEREWANIYVAVVAAAAAVKQSHYGI